MTKFCSKCGILKLESDFHKNKATHDGLSGQCKQCRIAYNKQRRKDKKVEIAARRKQHYQEHKEDVLKQVRKYRKDNIAKIQAHSKQYYQDNKKQINSRCSQYYQNNKEEISEWGKTYYKLNRTIKLKYMEKYSQTEKGKEVRRKHFHKWRSLKFKSGYENFSPKEILERDDYICQLCGRKTRPDYNCYHPLYPNLDHIIPLSIGGHHTKLNTQCLCRECNMKKSYNGVGDQLRMFG